MTKKQTHGAIIEMIATMEQNTFLFPKSWSEKIQMKDFDFEYKTYNSGCIGLNRHHNIEIFVAGDKVLDINFRRDNVIEVNQDLSAKQINIKDVYFYVKAIYDEKHSFKDHNEGLRKIRKEINSKLLLIKQEQEKVKELKQQIKDFNLIKTKK